MKKLLTATEVAEITGLPLDTIYKHRHLRSGVGALAVKVGRHLRWRESDIEAWLDEQVALSKDAAAG